MKRRWIIRIIFILPILLCVVGWVWSGTHFSRIEYGVYGHWWIACDLRYGVVDVMVARSGVDGGGWYCVTRPYPNARFWPVNSIFGFGYYGPSHKVVMPIWFLIFLFSLVLFFVWRKTRPKINPAM